MKTIVRKWIVFFIIPYSQRCLDIIAKMISQLSAILGMWAYSTAQGITHSGGDNFRDITSILLNSGDANIAE